MHQGQGPQAKSTEPTVQGRSGFLEFSSTTSGMQGEGEGGTEYNGAGTEYRYWYWYLTSKATGDRIACSQVGILAKCRKVRVG